MRPTLVFLSLFVVVAWSTTSNAADRVTAAEILREIELHGAKAVALKYYDTQVWAKSIDPGIRSAAPEWLNVADKLSPGAEAAAGEDIGLALYDALAVAPLKVLPVLSRKYGGTARYLCNVSYEADIPKEGANEYLNKVRRGLMRARTPNEKQLAAQCKKGLAQSLATAKSQGLL
jgi:hypothetical protein